MTLPALPPAYLLRFSGVARLYGMEALHRLAQAHFVIIGIGGVGSWAAEALARTGIGQITLIDMDEVCVSNTNRQLHTLTSTVGQSKAAVIAERLKGINPDIQVHIIDDFIQPENVAELLNKQQDAVIDCVDSAYVKAAIIGHCKRIKLTVITVGSSGGKRDPRQITSLDLSKTTNDPLLKSTRNDLRRHYNFARNTDRNFSIEAIYSTEQIKYPTPEGSVCENKSALVADITSDCGGGLGAVTMVTASFGLIACSRAIERFLAKPSLLVPPAAHD